MGIGDVTNPDIRPATLDEAAHDLLTIRGVHVEMLRDGLVLGRGA